MVKVVIVDYSIGNFRSVYKALKKAGADVLISNSIADFLEADAFVLPGVGAFRDAIKNIEPFKKVIYDQIDKGKPLLGICLGLQLLFTESTEGGLYEGLNIIRGRVIRLPERLKVPQIGWNTLRIVDPTNLLVEGLADEQYVYFVHSYYAKVEDESNVVATTEYGVDFPSIVAKGNILATQFHPEKSGDIGLKILGNFLKFVKR